MKYAASQVGLAVDAVLGIRASIQRIAHSLGEKAILLGNAYLVLYFLSFSVQHQIYIFLDGLSCYDNSFKRTKIIKLNNDSFTVTLVLPSRVRLSVQSIMV